ncbi:MAG: glutamine--fructose-6-phosphate transaminase (isomerizing) [Candidatus Diapherotrites archaeon]|uniref:Glutamine--fructose-6-phosphate aminotransferase [isomerizing] n=2 Tax=Candidatus Iainarchaeum sp. TaxID=3101447 RepID=A0A8T4LD25_9ARCH|nr:glutamine--fructose-6-phosphate transaminase (isomerizing) [Candidatus Diapherotrites archaeon]
MCGIIGYKGGDQAVSIVLEGLKTLEYRGYDSWGIAFLDGTGLQVKKNVGKIGNFKGFKALPEANLALGHTRWATHGGVTQSNAHPHLSNNKRIAVAHNGIVENYQALRKRLQAAGYTFHSQTDTETIPLLVEDFLKKGDDFPTAVRHTCLLLEGRYSFIVLDADSGQLIGARNGSPLLAGLGKDEFFLASDIPAFLPHTNQVVFLDDQQLVLIDSALRLFDLRSGKQLPVKPQKISWTPEQAEKGKFPHFMLKEILEQRESVSRALVQDDEQLEKIAQLITRAKQTVLVGCGTAGKMCLAGTYLFAKIAGRQTHFCVGSEFPNFAPFVGPDTLVIAVSQSGETADTLEALSIAKKRGAKVVSLLNVYGSTMMRQSDYNLLINAGPEKAVASTKAATGQLAVLALLAYATAGRLAEGRKALQIASAALARTLDDAQCKRLKALAQKIKAKENLYIIGRGLHYPIALESAIKLQEVSYIHAEGFAGGELKHGPIALIEKRTPCIVLAACDETQAEVLSNAMEVKSRGAYIIGLAPQDNEVFDLHLPVPDLGIASAIAELVPVQLLAYYLAVLRGNDPDKPRNLAKSVTVK